MATLNMTKVAVGCADAGELAERTAGRDRQGEVHVHTRYRPTRHAELIGGSLFWIVKHRLIARQEIRGFAQDERGHCIIRLDPRLVPVRLRVKRAHQGWRYLAADDAPTDHDGEADPLAEMPPAMAGTLAALALI